MGKSMGSPLRIAARAAVTAALGLALAGAAAAPAVAAEAGVITREFGRGFPTEESCNDAGHSEQRRQHADRYYCQPESNKTWTGYLQWYTR